MKKVGVIIFVFSIILALGLVFLRRVHITRRNTPSSTVSQQEEREAQDKPVGKQTTQNQSQDAQKSSNGSSGGSSTDSIVLNKIVAEEKLSYSGADQTTVGRVKAKNCYLQGTQIIYCIDIEATMGTAGQVMQYYCTYSTYDSLQVGQALSVIYKQTTANTFAVMSVQLANS